MARNMYGATSADFTLTSGGRVIPGATLTLWSARTGGTQITDLLDVDSVACTTVTSAADGSVVYYGPDGDKDVHWADVGQGARVAIRPVDITGEPPVFSIGTVTTGTAAASLSGTSEEPVLSLVLPSAGTDGVNTAAIQDDAVTAAKIAANAVGASELADNAVDTAAIADSAVTSAKIANGTITATDVAASTFAAFGTVGNLLTANQASGTDTLADTTGFTDSGGSPTVASSTTSPYQGSRCLSITTNGTGVNYVTIQGPEASDRFAVDPLRGPVTFMAQVKGAAEWAWRPFWWTAAGAAASRASDIQAIGSTGSWGVSSFTVQPPADAAYVTLTLYRGGGTAGAVTYLDALSFHKGAAGQFALPGTPIVGGSHIATNGAVDLSGTGSPEGVITAAPGSTWLQTDATTDVKGWLRWIKASGTGNTGWQVGPEADTGWRNVSLLNGWTGATGKFVIRRVGNTVHYRASYINGSAATNDVFYTAPSGFRSEQVIVTPWGNASTALFVVRNGGNVDTTSRAAALYGYASFITHEAWPSSLPGSAA